MRKQQRNDTNMVAITDLDADIRVAARLHMARGLATLSRLDNHLIGEKEAESRKTHQGNIATCVRLAPAQRSLIDEARRPDESLPDFLREAGMLLALTRLEAR